jgi:hypothetical protein
MIGPHEGRELQLMLAGEKALALIDTVVWRDGEAEPLLDEGKYGPYFQSGKLLRFEHSWVDVKGRNSKILCATLPEQAWRADAYFWLRTASNRGVMPYDDAVHVMIGRLLGYKEEDIQHFLVHCNDLP